jgi:hypothetical protein
MKRIIFEFEPGGDEGVYEMEEVHRHLKSLDLCLCLDEIRRMLNERRDNAETDEEYELYDKLFDKFFDILEQHNVNLEELIS